MFGNSHQAQQIDALRKRVQTLEGLIDVLASRIGISDAELLELRSTAGPSMPAESVRLLAQGRHIEAIKVYREQTGAGLKEAKDAVDAYRDSPR